MGNDDDCAGDNVCARYNANTFDFMCCPCPDNACELNGVAWCRNGPGGRCSDGIVENCEAGLTCGRYNSDADDFMCCECSKDANGIDNCVLGGVAWCRNAEGGACSEGINENCEAGTVCGTSVGSCSGYACCSEGGSSVVSGVASCDNGRGCSDGDDTSCGAGLVCGRYNGNDDDYMCCPCADDACVLGGTAWCILPEGGACLDGVNEGCISGTVCGLNADSCSGFECCSRYYQDSSDITHCQTAGIGDPCSEGNGLSCDEGLICGRYDSNEGDFMCCECSKGADGVDNCELGGVAWCRNPEGGACSDGVNENCEEGTVCGKSGDGHECCADHYVDSDDVTHCLGDLGEQCFEGDNGSCEQGLICGRYDNNEGDFVCCECSKGADGVDNCVLGGWAWCRNPEGGACSDGVNENCEAGTVCGKSGDGYKCCASHHQDGDDIAICS